MELPNSHLVVSYSVKDYEFAESADNIVRADREVETSWAVFKTGHDGPLDWIFEQRPGLIGNR